MAMLAPPWLTTYCPQACSQRVRTATSSVTVLARIEVAAQYPPLLSARHTITTIGDMPRCHRHLPWTTVPARVNSGRTSRRRPLWKRSALGSSTRRSPCQIRCCLAMVGQLTAEGNAVWTTSGYVARGLFAHHGSVPIARTRSMETQTWTRKLATSAVALLWAHVLRESGGAAS